jgi:competence protein ComEC
LPIFRFGETKAVKERNMLRWRKIALFLLLGLLVMAMATGCGGPFGSASTAHSDGVSWPLVVKVLDVGQGDAILVRAGGQVLLVDTGDVPARDKLVSYLKAQGITTIDKLFITHPHADHLGGFAAIVDNFTIKQVYDSGQSTTTALYRQYLAAIEKKKIPFTVLTAGDGVDLSVGVALQVLGPAKPLLTGTDADSNNNSLVLRLTFGKFAMLLAGDAEQAEETEIVHRYGRNLQSAVLKSGHHGSRTASSPAFLKAVAPEAALISVGATNDYHHPHSSTLKKYETLKIKVFRTDLDGTLTVVSDGVTYDINKEKH